MGHHLRELGVYASGLLRVRATKNAVFLVDGPPGGLSSGLRGYALEHELRSLGWRVTVIPSQLDLKQRHRIIERESPGVLVLQSCRHPLNHTELYPGKCCVFDLDDADFLDSAQRERVINCARGSVAAIAGSNFVANFLRNYNNNVSVVWTGSNPLFRPAVAKISPPVLVWACSDPFGYPAEKSDSGMNGVLAESLDSWHDAITFS